MQCPNCEGEVDRTLLNIEQSAEEDGVEVTFQCPWCRLTLFAVLTSADFWLVD